MKIGIPRALYYYEYFSFWQTFFTQLGFQVILSRSTNKEIMNWGVSLAVEGACLPVKIYHGHIYDLKQQDLDYLFIPRIISIARDEYICPKFMGLPDMISNSVTDLPPVLSPVIDARKGGRQVFQAYLNLGRKFKPVSQVVQAYYQGLKALKKQRKFLGTPQNSKQLTLGILGHEYLIYDEFLTMGILERIKARGYQIYTIDSLDTSLVNQCSPATIKRMFWTSGRKIISSANYLQDQVDGLISLVAFSCGIDSLVSDLVERFSQRNQMPHLLLNLDEHTGEAGILTRVEAFLEMLERRAANETHRSPHGELLHSI